MNAFVINLPEATERWEHVEKVFAATEYPLIRVEAVDGSRLATSTSSYAERSFLRRHGRSTNWREVGCYLSHVRALEMFLATGHEHALICEDDIDLLEGAAPAIEGLLRLAGEWDLARLSGLREPAGFNARPLGGRYFMRVNFGRLKGAGAYLVNRKAARQLVPHLLPMRVPYDHALDREWVCGLRAVSISPFPVDQQSGAFRTSIQLGPSGKLSSLQRIAFTFPYQAFNEACRWLFRAAHSLTFFHLQTPRREARGSAHP